LELAVRRRKQTILASALLAGVLVLMVAGEYKVMRRSSESCSICQRHINPKAEVIVEVGGARRRVCCAHCALVDGAQRHQSVRLLEVSDYYSGSKLSPASAWYVEGSRVMACNHDANRVDEGKRAEQMAFDRCSPGTFAFAQRRQAEQFVAENGGVVRSLDELMRSFEAAATTARVGGPLPMTAR
jgi:nitrous oxide reductase accessory protein NosL